MRKCFANLATGAIALATYALRETMPTIAGIGLTPLLQWMVVPAAILVVVRWAHEDL